MNKKAQSFESNYYQPNILLAIILGLHTTDVVNISMSNFPNDKILNDYINAILSAFTVENRPLIDITKNSDYISLSIKQNEYVLKKDSLLNDFSEIECKKYLKDYLFRYARNLERDNLQDELINRESWETLLTDFTNSLDLKCNLNDYKIFSSENIPVIAVLYSNKQIYIKELKFRVNYVANVEIFDKSCWEVKITLGLKPFIRKINGENRELIQKYSLREQQVLDYVENYQEEYISPEELLDIIQPDSEVNYHNKKKYLSNFISRLNKKYIANTGYRRFSGKIFKDVYKIELVPEEN